jgi:DNA-binding beta-propeller fold protein YncE
VFLLTLWDVETMILIVPPGGESLATRIFGLLHYGHNPQVNALCLVLLGAALAPLLIYGGWQCWHAATPGRRAILCLTLAVMTMCFSGCREKAHVNQNRLASRSFTHVEIVGTRGVGLGQFNKPRSVAVDLQDNMYVVDMTGRVQKFSPLGHFLLSWQMPQTDLGKPKGMGRDNQGNVLVVEPHYQRINYFSIEGNLVTQWGQRGTNAGQLNLPRAVAVNSRGDVFVSEYGPVERVQHFRADGVFLDGFGHAGNGPGEFNRPEGLCIDSRDQIYVADSCNHRIQIFNAQGKFLRAYGKAGASLGEMSYPYDILVDKSGRQYVCEFGNSRIQIFDAQDKPMEIIGGPGSEPGKFNNPWGVAMDSKGALYVADSQNHRVQKLVPPAETAQAIGARKKGSF